jgi:hypothetical protein
MSTSGNNSKNAVGRTYTLPHYNGFTSNERFASIPIQNEAVRQGLIKQPDTCSICGFSKPDNLKGQGYIFMHLECYAHPLDIYPACKRCHAALHARFVDPGRWIEIVKANFREGAWFTMLTLNPKSQWMPYNVIYPNGLPAP